MTFVTGRDFKKHKIHAKITKSEMAKFRLFAFFQKRTPAKHSSVLRENSFLYGVFVSNDGVYLRKAPARYVVEQ